MLSLSGRRLTIDWDDSAEASLQSDTQDATVKEMKETNNFEDSDESDRKNMIVFKQ